MKNLLIPCFLIVSLTISAQFQENRTIDFGNLLSSNFNNVTNHISTTLYENIFEVEVEEADEAFDFDIQNYLPEGFDPFAVAYNSYANVYEYFVEEEEESLEFDTTEYLPSNFNAYADVSINENYELLNMEEDEEFEFDTASYLPKGFDAYNEDEKILADYEKLNEEKDAKFDFDINEFLPKDFVAYR